MRILRHIEKHSRNVNGAVVLTFAFSARFFERVVLPLLHAKNTGQNNVVLLDREFYSQTLDPTTQETKPMRAGQDYFLAPIVTPPNRAFHPKILFFGGERYAAAYIGSANQTQQALTHNREVMAYVESAASDLESPQHVVLLDEVRQFIGQLHQFHGATGMGMIPKGRIQTLVKAANWTADHDVAEPKRDCWFVHNLNEPILSQIFDRIEARNETPQRAWLAAPFYGGTLAVPRSLTDRDIETTLWLQTDKTQIDSEKLNSWLEGNPQAAARVYADSRYTHGKVLQIETEDGRYSLAGSPNLSPPALLMSASAGGDRGNVEAAMLRRESSNERTGFFNHAPFSRATDDVTTFTSTSRIPPGTDETSIKDEQSVVLTSAGFRVHQTYDGGTLELSANVPNVGSSPPVTVILTGEATPDEEEDQLEINSNEIEEQDVPDDTIGNGSVPITIHRNIQTKADSQRFLNGGQIQLAWGDSLSNYRWLDVYRSSKSEEAVRATEDAGTQMVPQLLPQLLMGDSEHQAEILDSLNTLLGAMRSRSKTTNGDGDNQEASSDDQGLDNTEKEAPGGLKMRDWSQSGSGSNPKKVISSFYDGWAEDIDDWIFEIRQEPEEVSALIGNHLGAINRANLLLLLVERAAEAQGRPISDSLRILPRQFTKQIYTQHDVQRELNSSVARLLQRAEVTADDSAAKQKTVQEGLAEHIAPNIILAALISQEHIAATREEYFRQHSWGFEELLTGCFLTTDALLDVLEPNQITKIRANCETALDDIRLTIEHSDLVNRYASKAYLIPDHLESRIREACGRALLIDGPSAMREYRQRFRPSGISEIERVFDQEIDLLPQKQRRIVERDF